MEWLIVIAMLVLVAIEMIMVKYKREIWKNIKFPRSKK